MNKEETYQKKKKKRITKKNGLTLTSMERIIEQLDIIMIH